MIILNTLKMKQILFSLMLLAVVPAAAMSATEDSFDVAVVADSIEVNIQKLLIRNCIHSTLDR
jgi:D-alanyl-D-alanine dipeptidase